MENVFFNNRSLPKKISNWDLMKFITTHFRSLIIVGAGNHYGLTPTVTQIAHEDLNLDRFKIIRPHFDYETVEDRQFENLLKKAGYPFYRQIFQEETHANKVVFFGGFPNCYKVKRSFATAFGSAIRLDLENLIASRITNLNDEPFTDHYRSLLASCNNVMSFYDHDFHHKFPELELQSKFLNHLSKDVNRSDVIIHPLDYFYQTFDQPQVRWLNLNQDGILEENIKNDRVVSYHGNVCLTPDGLVIPGYTGPIDIEAKEKTTHFISEVQIIVSLGYSFSDYDYDILELIDRAEAKIIIIFDLDAERVCRNLRSHFPKSRLIPKSAILPLMPDDYSGFHFDDNISSLTNWESARTLSQYCRSI